MTEETHSRGRRIVAVARAVAREARRQDVTLLAAAVAYYAFVSLVPLALLGVAAASAFGGDALLGAVDDAVGGMLTAEGRAVLAESLGGDAGRGTASVVGTAVLAWGGLRVFRGLDRAFSRIYGASEPKPLVDQLRDAATVLAAVAAGLAGMALAGAAVAVLPWLPVVVGAGVVGLWATLLVAFLPLYYVFPDAPVTVREALPGAGVAATTFWLLGALFGVYAAAAGASVYGVLGAVLLVVTWLYFGSIGVLVGAVTNAVLAGRAGE